VRMVKPIKPRTTSARARRTTSLSSVAYNDCSGGITVCLSDWGTADNINGTTCHSTVFGDIPGAHVPLQAKGSAQAEPHLLRKVSLSVLPTPVSTQL
jgi:hypothetical protein